MERNRKNREFTDEDFVKFMEAGLSSGRDPVAEEYWEKIHGKGKKPQVSNAKSTPKKPAAKKPAAKK